MRDFEKFMDQDSRKIVNGGCFGRLSMLGGALLPGFPRRATERIYPHARFDI
jgi:hypothetical protein